MLNIQQVLNITELRLHIIQFLDRNDYFACALVNKAWHHHFQPSVWETFRIGSFSNKWHYIRSQSHSDEVPSTLEKETNIEQELTSLRKYAHLIRHLHRHWPHPLEQSCFDSIMAVFLEHCRQLVSFHATVSHDDPKDWTLCIELAIRNPGLHCAVFHNNNPRSEAIDSQIKMSFYRAWRAAEMPSLRRLVLDRRISFLTLVCVVMKTCPSLEDLVVSSGIVSHTEDSFKQYLDSEDDGGHLSSGDKSKNNLLETFDSTCTKKWPCGLPQQFGLKRLEFGRGCYSEGLDMFLALCPLLETLILKGMSIRVCEAFCRVLRDGHLPNLTSVTLISVEAYVIVLPMVLEALPMHQLQYVHFWGATASDVKKLVERQNKSLKDVHLLVMCPIDEEDGEEDVGDDDVDAFIKPSRFYNLGLAVGSILASCSQLHTLNIRTDMDRAFDIRQLIAQPWVCKALRTLEIPIHLAHKCSDPRLLRHAEAEKRQAARQGRLLKRLQPMLQPNETPHDAQLSQGVEELEEWEQCEVVWMKYLGELNQLRVLKLGKNFVDVMDNEPVKYESLTWTLRLGLGYLKNLTLLEYLMLPPHSYLQDEREWMFMKQHWPKLRLLETQSHLPETYLNRIHDVWPELIVD